MSRCFPFPPPGYERKHRPENVDLLKEAKREEKKHKKEKKDKERKKDKEKKDKDGSDEKHREKKDRKEKHKDKKDKHKDKKEEEDLGKDKEKSSISEELTVAGKLEDRIGGKLQPKVHSKNKSSSSNEGKNFALCQGQNGGKPSHSSLPSLVNNELKFVRELDRRIRDEEKGIGSQLPEKVALLDKRDQEIAARAAIRNSSGLVAEGKVDNRNKKIEQKIDPQGVRYEHGGNTMAQNLMPMTKSKVERIRKPVDEQNGRRLEHREKCRETVGVKQGGKHKERDEENHVKEKDREKEKKRYDKAKMKTENKKSSQKQLKDDQRKSPGGFTDNKSRNLLKDTDSDTANEGNIRKRKDTNSNGFLHVCDIGPNKKLRSAVPHQLTENGRKLIPSQTPTKSPHEKHTVLNSVQMDNKDSLGNGVIEIHKPSPSEPKSSAVIDQNAEASRIPHYDTLHMKKPLKVPNIDELIAEASRRPAHPDSRCLVDVLTVPKMEDWPGYDDQEWLFSETGSSSKPNVGTNGVEEEPRVWSEAVCIESADVFALPYVIPY